MALTAKIRLLEQKLRQQEEELSTLRPKSQALEFELENAKQEAKSLVGLNGRLKDQFASLRHSIGQEPESQALEPLTVTLQG